MSDAHIKGKDGELKAWEFSRCGVTFQSLYLYTVQQLIIEKLSCLKVEAKDREMNEICPYNFQQTTNIAWHRSVIKISWCYIQCNSLNHTSTLSNITVQISPGPTRRLGLSPHLVTHLSPAGGQPGARRWARELRRQLSSLWRMMMVTLENLWSWKLPLSH